MSFSPHTITQLEAIVESFLVNGDPFTSLDIANLAKRQGMNVRNYQVAEWLRSNAIRIAYGLGALYNTTLIEVDSTRDGLVLANLYHHMNYDPDDYQARGQKPLTPPASVSAPIGAFSTKDGGVHVAPPVDDDEDDDLPDEVLEQHDIATGKANVTTTVTTTVTTPGARAVQRDIYGRFATDVAASNKKPPHFLQQHRDNQGRFKKDD